MDTIEPTVDNNINQTKKIIPLTNYGTALALCCFATLGCYLGTSMRFPLVPLYARSLGIATAQIGLITSSYFFFAGLFSFPMGIVSDKIGSKPVASTGLVMLAGATLLLCLCKTSVGFIAVHLIMGIGMAAFGPTMMSYTAEISPGTHLGRSYGWYTTALFGGMSIGPAVGGMLAQQFDFKPVFAFSALCLVLTLIMVFYLPPSDPAPNPSVRTPGTRGQFRLLRKNAPYTGCLLVTLGGAFSSGMFFTFIPLLAKDRGLSIRQIGIIFLVQALCNALSRIPMGTISDRVGNRKYLIMAGGWCTALSMLGFQSAQTMVHFLLSAGALGFSMAITFTSVGALIAQAVPAFSRGAAMGGYNTFIYFGMMAGSGTMGVVIQRAGFGWGFSLAFIVTAVLTGGFAWRTRFYAPQ